MSKTIFKLIEEHGLKDLKVRDSRWKPTEYVTYVNGEWRDEKDRLFLMDSANHPQWEVFTPLVWVNLHKNTNLVTYYRTKEDADRHAMDDRIACLEFTEGQGLENT